MNKLIYRLMAACLPFAANPREDQDYSVFYGL
jgi:hypothetical protein